MISLRPASFSPSSGCWGSLRSPRLRLPSARAPPRRKESWGPYCSSNFTSASLPRKRRDGGGSGGSGACSRGRRRGGDETLELGSRAAPRTGFPSPFPAMSRRQELCRNFQRGRYGLVFSPLPLPRPLIGSDCGYSCSIAMLALNAPFARMGVPRRDFNVCSGWCSCKYGAQCRFVHASSQQQQQAKPNPFGFGSGSRQQQQQQPSFGAQFQQPQHQQQQKPNPFGFGVQGAAKVCVCNGGWDLFLLLVVSCRIQHCV